jgi:hypothetical protein
MAQHLRNVADWRRWRFEDYNRDERNLRCARALESFADFVIELPADDERLVQLANLAGYDGEFRPGQQTNFAIGRFHFYNEDAGFDGFLDYLVELAGLDFTENGRFGGHNLPPGDDPWAGGDRGDAVRSVR